MSGSEEETMLLDGFVVSGETDKFQAESHNDHQNLFVLWLAHQASASHIQIMLLDPLDSRTILGTQGMHLSQVPTGFQIAHTGSPRVCPNSFTALCLATHHKPIKQHCFLF